MMELRAEKISQDFLRDSAREGYIVAVAETDLCLPSGTVTAVMGRSGSGKSTLLHILGGLLPPVTGKVLIGETDLYALPEDARAELRSSTLGIVPQQLMSLRALTVRENVLLSALLYGREQDVSAHADALMERLRPISCSLMSRRATSMRRIHGACLISCARPPTQARQSSSSHMSARQHHMRIFAIRWQRGG